MTKDWTLIWADFKDGNMDAFHQIYSSFFSKLYAYGSRLTEDSELVEDCIQEMFLTLYTQREKLALAINLEYYLLKSLRLTIYQKYRKQRKIEFLRLNQVMSDESGFEFELETEQNVEEVHKQEFIKNLLDSLDTKCREILYLKFYTGLSYEEIGEILSIQPDSAKKKVYRIISRLKKKYSSKILMLFTACFTA